MVETIFETGKTELVRKWTDLIFATYPFETTGFLRTQANRFANPVGHATVRAAELLYDAVIGHDVDQAQLDDALGELTRIRAVQDFKPSAAIGVLYLLKPILREAVKNAKEYVSHDTLASMEDRIDSLALMAFDMYAQDKDTMYRGRVAEIRRRYTTIERWIAKQGMDGMFPEYEFPGEKPEN